MSREHLKTASEQLAGIAEDVDDEAVSERLAGLAEQVGKFATQTRGPDHGRLARIENALHEIKASVDAEQKAAIEQAHEEIKAYRSTVSGI
ncbi:MULTISPECIES: hypothetical protein [unclassified Haladaptatus]|uniref:DUF7553 family protein n=1 Tax=unclassified Haladaptatus TaxID=2622732 RepID=UPI0023E79B56|nr:MULTISPECIES: hypothetical protein [unclassified Haladaptatus]